MYRCEHQLRSDEQSAWPLRVCCQLNSIKILLGLSDLKGLFKSKWFYHSMILKEVCSVPAGQDKLWSQSQRGGVGRDALLSVFILFYILKTQNWNKHFSNLAPNQHIVQSPPRGSPSAEPLFHNQTSAEQLSDVQAWKRKGESSVLTRGKITKNPSVWLFDDIRYIIWASLWIPDKSICYAELDHYLR